MMSMRVVMMMNVNLWSAKHIHGKAMQYTHGAFSRFEIYQDIKAEDRYATGWWWGGRGGGGCNLTVSIGILSFRRLC